MRITLKTAKLAKEKGFNSIRKQDISDSYYSRFNGETFHFYMNDEFVVAETNSNLIFGLINNYQGKTTPYEYYLAPIQSELQTWLREVHKIQIEIEAVWNQEMTEIIGYYYFNYKTWSEKVEIVFKEMKHFDTYEQALEAALLKSLKLI